MADITVTFKDGTSHVYQNAPDDVTPDAVEARATKDFNKPVASLSKGTAKPAEPPKPAEKPTFLGGLRKEFEEEKKPQYRPLLEKVGKELTEPVGDFKTPKNALNAAATVVNRATDVAMLPMAAIGDAVNAVTGGAPAAVNSLLTKTVGTAANKATGGAISEQQAGMLASALIPLAGEVMTEARIAEIAKQTGVSVDMVKKAHESIKTPNQVKAAEMRGETTPKPDLAAAFQKAKVRPSLAASGPGVASITKSIGENPIAGIRVRKHLADSLDDTKAAVERTAGLYGAATSRGEAGEAVQDAIGGFNERFSTDASKRYDAAFTSITEGQKKAKAEAEQAAALKRGRGGEGVKPQAVIAPSSTLKTTEAIQARGSSPALKNLFSSPQVAKISEAVLAPESLSFQDLRDARTWVREAQGNPELRQSVGKANLQRLEHSLTEDIYANAEKLAGPDALKKLKEADAFYREGSERVKGALQAFVGKGEHAPKAGESTFDLVIRAAGSKGGADIARLRKLKQSLQPQEWDDLAATVIHRLGESPDGKMPINKFVTAYDNMSSEGKDLLFGNGEKRAELDNLVVVARAQKNVEAAANHSNTAVAAQSGGTFMGLMNPSTTLPTLGGLAGGAAVGEALTNPGLATKLGAHLLSRGSTSPRNYLASATRRIDPLVEHKNSMLTLNALNAIRDRTPDQ